MRAKRPAANPRLPMPILGIEVDGAEALCVVGACSHEVSGRLR